MSGAQILFYPTAIGWLPAEKAGARRAAAGRLGDHPAEPRHRQRRLRVRREPRRARGRSRRRHRVLGRQLRLRSGRAGARASGGTGEEVLIATLDLAQGGRQPHPLAVPPRPAHRRVRGHHSSDTWTDSRGRGHDVTLSEAKWACAARRRLHFAQADIHARPADPGFRMPAEWEPHRGTWLSWPHKEASWPGKFGPVPGIFARWCGMLADQEEVHINVAGPDMEADVRRSCSPTKARTRGNVFFHYSPDQRRLVPRPRPDLRAARQDGRPRSRRRSSTGTTTPGAASTRPTISTTSSPPGSRKSSASRSSTPGS